MVTWPGLMAGNRPLLKDWAVVFKKKWQTKVRGLGTLSVGLHKELGAIRRIVMWQHFYRTVRSCDLWASEIKCLGDLGVQHTHNLTAETGPSAK